MSRNALTGVTPGFWRNKRATQTRIYVTERASAGKHFVGRGHMDVVVIAM